MPDLLTVLSVYLKEGFEITGLFPESRDMENLRVMEFNGVLVRKEMLKGR